MPHSGIGVIKQHMLVKLSHRDCVEDSKDCLSDVGDSFITHRACKLQAR